MRRRLGQSLRIGVSRDAVSLLRSSRWGGPALTVMAERAVDADGADHGEARWQPIVTAVEQLLAEHVHAGWPVSLIVADDLSRLWQVTPPPGVGALADLEAAAALRFLSLYGETLQTGGWSMRADWDSRAPFFAAAMPSKLLAALEQVAAASGLTIVDTAPHFIDAWNRWSGALKPAAWYGLVHDDMLTIAAVEQRRLRAVRVLPLAPEQSSAAGLVQLIEREALLLDLAMPAHLQLCGQAPPAWLSSASGLQIGVLDQSQRASLAGAATAISPAVALALCGSRA
jgi:hypothetical protein